MKIISKYKDYYDYLQGVYGVDEKLVLDRRLSEHPAAYSNGVHRFVIGNTLVDSLYIDGVWYCGEADMIKIGGERYEQVNPKDGTKLLSYRVNYKDLFGKIVTNSVCVTPYGRIGNPINNSGHAIYLISKSFGKEKYFYPRLEQYGIQKVLKPHDIWVELSNWLGMELTKKEPQQPVGDDKVRILSAGFDLKTSFRNIK